MSDSWNEMEAAKEGVYFERLNHEALERLQQRQIEEQKPRTSPITGKPMISNTMDGIVFDRCPDSGGIFLDRNEIDKLHQQHQVTRSSGWINRFFAKLLGKAPS